MSNQNVLVLRSNENQHNVEIDDSEALILKPKRTTHKLTLATPIAVGTGTGDYEALINKPVINGVEVIGSLSLEDLGITEGVLTPLTISDLTNLLGL